MRVRTYLWIGVAVAVAATATVAVLALGDLAGPAAPDGTTGRTGFDPLGGVTKAPRVTDSPRVDASIATKISTEGTTALSASDASTWELYLAESRKTVQENVPELEALVDRVLGALRDDDISALSDMWAPDEQTDAAYIQSILATYPRVEHGTFQPSVNIFSVERATVYFAYTQVEWTDGGVVSSHTIAIPVRFIDGQWYLSSMGLNTEGLTPVQSVSIP